MYVSINQSIQSLTEKHALNPFWQNLLAPIQAQALSIALKVNLFDHLAVLTSAQQLASILKWHPENTAYFLHLLTSMQLLDISQEIHSDEILYRNTQLSTQYFKSTSPEYCGDAFSFRYQVVQNVATQLETTLAHDFIQQKRSEEHIAQAWANAAQLQIAQEQTAVSVHIAEKISHLVNEFEIAESFLDIGGGAGLISLHFAQQYPHLHCTILELPDVIHAIQKRLSQDHVALDQRMKFISANLQTIDLDQSYDIIWCSSVLHFVEDYQKTLSKIYAALKPNGVLICAHSEVDPNSLDPLIQSYYFNMRVQGNFVPIKGQIAMALEKMGCSNIQSIEHVQFPVAPLNVIIARK